MLGALFTTILVSRYRPPCDKVPVNKFTAQMVVRLYVLITFTFTLPGNLSSNLIERERLGKCFTLSDHAMIKIPGGLIRDLLWPPHIALLELEEATHDASEAICAPHNGTTRGLQLLDGFHNYTYDPRHMLCYQCLIQILRVKFWSWWEVHYLLPLVNAADLPNCGYGLECQEQSLPDHATQLNVGRSYFACPSLTAFQHWCFNTISDWSNNFKVTIDDANSD
jgi:hypothetical protein